MISRRQLLALGSSIVAGTVAAACSDDAANDSATLPNDADPSPPAASDPPATNAATSTVAPTTTTIDPAELAMTYAEAGPHPVGVTTLQLPSGPLVEVWYPAVEGTTGEVTYDVRDFTPEAIKALLTADLPAVFTIQAGRDAAPAGTFPLVLFSHGFSGIRVQSSFLTSHLASWGFVVAAPDHPSRALPNVLAPDPSQTPTDSVAELLETIDVAINASLPDGPLAGAVDTARIIALGHSAGGGTVLRAAADDRITGYISMASGAFGGSQQDPAATTTLPTLPGKPSFFLAGALDAVVEPQRTRSAYELAPEPSLLWVIDGVGHNGFDDFCTLGGGTGIIGVAEASGLGAFLDAQPSFRTLGEDGCLPPAVPVEETFPIIRHAVTAWARWHVGEDPERIGVDSEVAEAYDVAVEIASKG